MTDRTARRSGRVGLVAFVGVAAVVMAVSVVLGSGSAHAGAAPVDAPPSFTAPVVDAAGVVPDGVEQSVDLALEDYRRRSGRQVAVAVIRTTGDASLEDYTIDLARKWGVGTKGRDNGVLLLVATRDRRVRIEVGRGVEGRLTDLEAGRIISERLVPLLAAGRYGAAVQQGSDAIRAALGDRRVGTRPPAASEPVAEPSSVGGVALFLPIFLIGLFLSSLFGRRRRRRRWRGMGAPMIWGGGFGGGGFGGGGFGGGGGGGFGGGGASGSW